LAFIVLLAIILTVFFIPNNILLGMLPLEVTSRLGTMEESLFFRIRIWFDTWKMFADQPITGIGLGGFESYLLAENPSMKNYMGIGNTQTGIFIPGQPESGYFKILYEGGLLGSLAAFLLVIAAFRRAFLVLHSPDALPEWKTEVVGSLISLVVFGLSFATLFTLSDERNIVILVLPLAIIWARSMALDTILKVKKAVSISQRKRRFS
jgi:O-antigen ligase